MNDLFVTGTVSFVNHEKNYILIEYDEKGKKRSARGNTGAADGKQKKQLFRMGDTVSFRVSDHDGHITATNIRFLYNTALDVLVNKAHTANNFIGYLKEADGKYFVKEIDSYIFFPLQVSPWQVLPTGTELNAAVTFSLE